MTYGLLKKAGIGLVDFTWNIFEGTSRFTERMLRSRRYLRTIEANPDAGYAERGEGDKK
jgi:hypothetical protein